MTNANLLEYFHGCDFLSIDDIRVTDTIIEVKLCEDEALNFQDMLKIKSDTERDFYVSNNKIAFSRVLQKDQ